MFTLIFVGQEMNKPIPEIKTIWSIHLVILVIISGAGIFAADIFILNDLFNISTGIITGIYFALGIIYSIISPMLQYKYMFFEILENEIYTEQGVFTRIKTSAPFSRVQHIDLRQGILERWFGLATIAVYTAGTRGADLRLTGLPLDYAVSLRDLLKDYTFEDAI